jgi:hypothetical protein
VYLKAIAASRHCCCSLHAESKPPKAAREVGYTREEWRRSNKAPAKETLFEKKETVEGEREVRRPAVVWRASPRVVTPSAESPKCRTLTPSGVRVAGARREGVRVKSGES